MRFYYAVMAIVFIAVGIIGVNAEEIKYEVDNPTLPKLNPEIVNNVFGNGSTGGGGNITSVTGDNCIISSQNMGDVFLTFNLSCAGNASSGDFIPYRGANKDADLNFKNFTNLSSIGIGDNNNSKIYYDGTNLVIDPKVTGTGYIDSNGADAKIDQIGIVGSVPISTTGIFGSVTSSIVSSLINLAIVYQPTLPGSNALISGNAVFNTTTSGIAGTYSGVDMDCRVGKSNTAAVCVGVEGTAGIFTNVNLTSGTYNFYGVRGGMDTPPSASHGTSKINIYGIYGLAQTSLPAILNANLTYWAGYFDDDVQVTVGSKLLIDGTPGTKGSTYFIGNQSGEEALTYVKNVPKISVNTSRTWLANQIVMNANSRFSPDGSQGNNGASYWLFSTVPAGTYGYEFYLNGSRAIGINGTSIIINGSARILTDQKLILSGTYTTLNPLGGGSGNSYITYNGSQQATQIIVNNTIAQESNLTSSWLNGTVRMKSGNMLVLEGDYATNGDSGFKFDTTGLGAILTIINGRLGLRVNQSVTYINNSLGVNKESPVTTLEVNGHAQFDNDVNLTIGNVNFGLGNVTNATFINTRKLTSNIKNITTPKIGIQSGAGGGADTKLFGGDLAGIFQIRTNGVPLANTPLVSVTYNLPCNTNSSSVVLQQANSTSNTLTGGNEVVTEGNQTGFRVISGATPLASLTDYRWYYHAICFDQFGEFDGAFNP